MKKSQNMPVLLSKMVLAQKVFTDGEVGKAQESLTPVVDWQNGLIGPSGCQLVVFYLL
jgi:hypothetical protein